MKESKGYCAKHSLRHGKKYASCYPKHGPKPQQSEQTTKRRKDLEKILEEESQYPMIKEFREVLKLHPNWIKEKTDQLEEYIDQALQEERKKTLKDVVKKYDQEINDALSDDSRMYAKVLVDVRNVALDLLSTLTSSPSTKLRANRRRGE